MVQVVTETGNQEAEHLQVVREPVHLAGLQHREHRLANIESVPPVVVFDWTIVLLDTESPATDNLAEDIIQPAEARGRGDLLCTEYGIY